MKRRHRAKRQVLVLRKPAGQADNLNKTLRLMVGPVPMIRRLVESVEDEQAEICVDSAIGRLLVHAEVGESFVTGERGGKVIVKVLGVV